MKPRNPIQAFGINIPNIPSQEAYQRALRFLYSPLFHLVVTINPDLLMAARRNQLFFSTLQKADLLLIDGIGIYLPAILQGKWPKGRLSGSDFTKDILRTASQMNLSIFLLVNADGLSSFQEVRSNIQKVFPKAMIFGIDTNIKSQSALTSALEQASQHPIVLSNFGAPDGDPILLRISNIPNNQTRFAMNVGGTFDFMTGKQKRAPFIMRKFGFEWLWRLILQPKRRFRRTWNYVVVYSALCLKQAIVSWISFFFHSSHHEKSYPIKTIPFFSPISKK